jgi:Trk K+ transport system NAD-binding subunit
VEEIEIGAASPWVGNPLSEIGIHARHNLLVLAVKSGGDAGAPKLWVNPPDKLMVRGGTAIIVMGDVKDIRTARSEARSADATAKA